MKKRSVSQRLRPSVIPRSSVARSRSPLLSTPPPTTKKRRSPLQQLLPSTSPPTRRPRLFPPRSNFRLRQNIRDEAQTASRNALRTPIFASNRLHFVGCSEAPLRTWSEERHNVLEREISWLTKHNPLSSTYHHPARRPLVLAGVLLPHVPPVHPAAVLAVASSSVARRSASSAPRRSTPSPTATFACFRASLPSAARSFRAA